MCVEVAGGSQVTFDDLPIEIGDDQVVEGEGGIIDSTGLDDNQRLGAGAIDAAGIAESVRSEAATGYFLIGAKNLLA